MWGLLIGLIGGWRAIARLLIVVAIPLILYNLTCDIIQEVMNFAISQISSSNAGESPTIQLTGLVGWIAQQFQFPECLSVIISITMLKFILRKIPFLRW